MTLANEIVSAFKGFKTFTFNDVRMVLVDRHRNISDKTIQVTISRMVKNHKIYAITKGVFSLQRRDELAGFAFSPFYYGGLAALMIRDLIDDQVKMEIMTTRAVKRSLLAIYDRSSMVVLHHIPKRYYFGFQNVKYGDIVVPVSDPEKTLIDLIYYRSGLAVQNYDGLLRALDIGRLDAYLKRYDNRTRTSVLRFVKRYRHAATSGRLRSAY